MLLSVTSLVQVIEINVWLKGGLILINYLKERWQKTFAGFEQKILHLFFSSSFWLQLEQKPFSFLPSFDFCSAGWPKYLLNLFHLYNVCAVFLQHQQSIAGKQQLLIPEPRLGLKEQNKLS